MSHSEPRTCPVCGASLDGKRRDAKFCSEKCYARAYNAANREKIGERKRAYDAANREKIGERKRAYYAANREKIGERKRSKYRKSLASAHAQDVYLALAKIADLVGKSKGE